MNFTSVACDVGWHIDYKSCLPIGQEFKSVPYLLVLRNLVKCVGFIGRKIDS